MKFRFRFSSDDHERYGDQWWTFDEADLARLRSRELIAIERELKASLGINIIDAVQMLRRPHGEAMTGTLALMWIARRLGGVTEPLDEFDPIVLLADTEQLPEDEEVPPAGASSSLPENAEA